MKFNAFFCNLKFQKWQKQCVRDTNDLNIEMQSKIEYIRLQNIDIDSINVSPLEFAQYLLFIEDGVIRL